MLEKKELKLTQGNITYYDTEGSGFPLLLIHGNSCSSKVFKEQIRNLCPYYRMITFDLPGHGNSEISKNPEYYYTIPGFADIVEKLIDHLQLQKFSIIGFSLGGNIALQFSIRRMHSIQSIALISSAPMKYSHDAFLAYPPYEGSFSAHPDQLTESQAKKYFAACGFQVDDPELSFIVEDAMKTDGNCRAKMVASVLDGKGIDETDIIQKSSIPLALILGNNDKAVGLNYLNQLTFKNLWRKKIQFIEGAEHAIPLHQAEQLDLLLKQFLNESF